MNTSLNDWGVITAVFEHLDLQAIPRALAIKAEVESGAVLNELDLLFFEECLDEMVNLLPVIDRHPEFQPVVSQLVDLCHEITQKAFENQVENSDNSGLHRFRSKLSQWSL